MISNKTTIIKLIVFFFVFACVNVTQASQENILVLEYQKHLLHNVIQPAFVGTLLNGHAQILAIIASYLSITPQKMAFPHTETISALMISKDDRCVMFEDSSGIHTWYVENEDHDCKRVIRSWPSPFENIWNKKYVVEWCKVFVQVRSTITGKTIRGCADLYADIDIHQCFLLKTAIVVMGTLLDGSGQGLMKWWRPAQKKLTTFIMFGFPIDEIHTTLILSETQVIFVAKEHVYSCNLRKNICHRWLNMAILFASPYCTWLSFDLQYMVTAMIPGNAYHISLVIDFESIKTVSAEMNCEIYPLCMSNDNKIIIEEHQNFVESSKELIMRWWETNTSVNLRLWYVDFDKLEGNIIGTATISKDDTLLLYAAYGSTVVRFWNIKTSQHVLTLYQRLPLQNLNLQGPMFLSDMNILLSISSDHQLELMDIGYLHYEDKQKIKHRLFITFLEKYRIQCLLTKLFNQGTFKVKNDGYK